MTDIEEKLNQPEEEINWEEINPNEILEYIESAELSEGEQTRQQLLNRFSSRITSDIITEIRTMIDSGLDSISAEEVAELEVIQVHVEHEFGFTRPVMVYVYEVAADNNGVIAVQTSDRQDYWAGNLDDCLMLYEVISESMDDLSGNRWELLDELLDAFVERSCDEA